VCSAQCFHVDAIEMGVPGGKVEEGESEEECLLREIQEEPGLVIQITDRLRENIHQYHKETGFAGSGLGGSGYSHCT
jgi:8-oxo-dGTP pyrophosphatase MutT (NUDIX family)